jgi:hypothetical protein
MKSIKQQYIDLMEGRMSQHNFMRSLRMTMPQYVTNVTSFKDSVKILKNKGILSEAYANEAPSYDYNGKKLYVDNQSGEPDAPGGKVSLYDEEENEYIGTISSIDGEGFISVDPESIQPANGEDEDDEFIDMIAKAEEEEAGKYTKNYDFPGGLGEGDDASEALKTVKEPNPNAGKYRITSIDGKMVIAKDFFDSMEAAQEYAKKNIRTSYKIVKLPAERSVYKKIDEGRKKKEPKAELHPNQIHPQELRMGIKVELEHTDDLDKAKKIALDHLAENPYYYTALKLAGVESPSAPKAKYPVEKKAKKKKEAVEMVDAANQMQKVKMPKAVNEVRINAMPGEETNATMKHAMQYIDSEIANPTLKALSDKITLQSLRDNKALLRYEYWEPLPQDAINALEKQFDVEADTDIDDETLPREYYIISSKKTEKPEKYRAFQSKLEALVREVVAEYYDGRDNLDEDGGFEQWKQALYKIVMEKAKLEADEIAIDDAEIKQYYQKGKTPEEVYFDIWQQDAGNFFSISF